MRPLLLCVQHTRGSDLGGRQAAGSVPAAPQSPGQGEQWLYFLSPLLALLRVHQAPALSRPHCDQLLPDRRPEAGVQEEARVEVQVRRGAAPAQQGREADGQDRPHAGGSATAVPHHRVPPGHPGAAQWYTGPLLLRVLLSAVRRGHGHPGSPEWRHQLHPVLLHEPTVSRHIRSAL